MAARIAVSLEEKGVRIVYAATGPKSIKIQKTLLINEEELESFLKKEHSRSFIVSADFKNIFHDLIQIPPVADKFIKKIVSNEIRKRAPELGRFLFSYEVIGERFIEGRKVKDVFAVAVSEEETDRIIARFASCGKTVDAIYPNISCIAAFASASSFGSEDPALFVSESGFAKTLFLINKGKLVFVRTASSTGSGMRDFDVQNVNMTISYCRQTLKLNPSVVMLAGASCHEYEASGETIIPSVCMMLPTGVYGRQDVILDNIFPVSALLYRKKLKQSNMLPCSYKTEQMVNTFFKVGAACFVLLSAAGIVSLRISSDRVRLHEHKIKTLSAQVAAAAPAAVEIRDMQSRLKPFMSAIDALNLSSSEPSIKKALSSVGSFGSKGISLESLSFRVESGSVFIASKGYIKSGSYLQAQQMFAELIDSLQRSGFKMRSKKLDLKDNVFNIEAIQKGLK
ncbi:MAG: hypothetical protein JXR79_07280 [Nitrospirae bacterium]|nr:hypothetical protein [Nitrospirota bacterium]